MLRMFGLHGCTRGRRANGIFAAVCAAVNSKVIQSINRQPKGRHNAKNTMKTTKTIGMEKLNYLTRLITHGSVFVPVNIAKQVQQAAINLGFDVSAGICDTGEIALYTA